MYPCFIRLYQHMAWADREILSALDQLADPHESITRLFAHVVAAEHIWISRIRGRDIGTFAPWTQLSLEESRELAEANHQQYLDLVDGLSEERLGQEVAFHTTTGAAMRSVLGDILLHVALHGSYHRGQIASKLAAEGFSVPATDYFIFGLKNPCDADSHD